jgi:hypothetical protein
MNTLVKPNSGADTGFQVSKSTKKGYQTNAVLFVVNFLENDYTSMTSFGKCKLKLNKNLIIS